MRLSLPVLLLLALTGCSSDGGDEPGTSPAPAASSGAVPDDPADDETGDETGDETSDETSAELASVTDDAVRVTPPLEAHFFDAGPATSIPQVVETLADLGLTLSPGNQVGGYVYDLDDEDFRLCIEGPTGAYATYDTSPMSVFETGESGGCPA
jgi:hypothetical protein